MRRVWNDRAQWARSLRELPLLNDLTLETASSLISGEMGDHDAELHLVLQWTGVIGRQRAKGPHRTHPSLRNIDLRYGASRPLDGVLSTWMKTLAGDWVRLMLMSGIELLDPRATMPW